MCVSEQIHIPNISILSPSRLECHSMSQSIQSEGIFFMNKRDEYVAKVKAQLDDMNAQLDVLAAKSKSAKKEMQDKYKQEMADLRAQSSQVRSKLDEMKDAGEDVWENMVAEVEKIGDALKHSYNYFKSQF